MSWRRLSVAIGYPFVLAVTTVIFRSRPPDVRDNWLDWTSTNIANLGRHPVAAIITSGMFTDGGLAAWIVLSLVGLGAVSCSLGGRRTLLLVLAAHVAGTLISEGILYWRIVGGQAPASERFIVDVGPSYVVV